MKSGAEEKKRMPFHRKYRKVRACAAAMCALYMVYVMYVFSYVVTTDIETTTTKGERLGHSFLFVGGPHFSGTTLLTMMFLETENVATFELKQPTFRNRKAKNSLIIEEGQHLQDVFPTARAFGGPCRYASKKRSRLTELDHLPKENTLYDQWASKWDLTQSILLEKSPPHVMHSRWLQAVFRERTSGSISFVFTMKHPLSIYERHCTFVGLKTYLENWLSQMETLREDITRLEHAYVIRYEDWLSTESTATRTFKTLEGKILSIDREEEQHYDHWRQLQYFHGKVGTIKPYVATFKPLNPSDTLVQQYESRLYPFGYSLTTREMIFDVNDPNYAFHEYNIVVL